MSGSDTHAGCLSLKSAAKMGGRASGARLAAVGQLKIIARIPRQTRYPAFGPDVPERNSVSLAFGERLRAIRVAAGLSQEVLAVRCFMQRAQISAIECGKGTLDPPRILVVAQRLGASAGALIDGLETPIRRVGTARCPTWSPGSPGIIADALAGSLELPSSYAAPVSLGRSFPVGLDGIPRSRHRAEHGGAVNVGLLYVVVFRRVALCQQPGA
jgi:transcriptional regulator with XRE-family HTH domain